MDEAVYPDLDSEIEERAQRIRLALADVSLEDAAQICVLARVVRVDDGDLKALSKYKLLQNLTSEKPDPRNLKLASELGSEESAQAFTGGLVINITKHTVRDESLENIISKCDEIVLEGMTRALAERVKKLKKGKDDALLAACRELFLVMGGTLEVKKRTGSKAGLLDASGRTIGV